MSITKLSKGRYRCQVYDPAKGRNVHVGIFATEREAKAEREKARARLASSKTTTTVSQWRERWLHDPLFARPKESTRLYNAERTKAFTERFGDVRLADIGDDHVEQWLASGKLGTVKALRAMFSDAASAKGGRLIARNPFSGLGLARSKGNQDVNPPDEETVWALIRAAREWTSPGFAAWLQVACFTGMRHGELDALRWRPSSKARASRETWVDFERGRIFVGQQYSTVAGTFTRPKTEASIRWATLTPHARDALLSLPKSTEFAFTNYHGDHWTRWSRELPWRRVQEKAGYDGTLYLTTRHFFCWYARNVLGLDPEDIAVAVGHQDGGALIRRLYGHLDKDLALDRVAQAFEGRANVVPLRAAKEA